MDTIIPNQRSSSSSHSHDKHKHHSSSSSKVVRIPTSSMVSDNLKRAHPVTPSKSSKSSSKSSKSKSSKHKLPIEGLPELDSDDEVATEDTSASDNNSDESTEDSFAEYGELDPEVKARLRREREEANDPNKAYESDYVSDDGVYVDDDDNPQYDIDTTGGAVLERKILNKRSKNRQLHLTSKKLTNMPSVNASMKQVKKITSKKRSPKIALDEQPAKSKGAISALRGYFKKSGKVKIAAIISCLIIFLCLIGFVTYKYGGGAIRTVKDTYSKVKSWIPWNRTPTIQLENDVKLFK